MIKRGYTSSASHAEDVQNQLARHPVFLDEMGALWSARLSSVCGIEGWRVTCGNTETTAPNVALAVRRLLGMES